MKKAVAVLSIACVLLGCKSKNPAADDPCDYDGYRKISFTSDGMYMTKDDFYDKNNAMMFYYTFTYNADNNIESVVVHDPAGADIAYILCTLNSAGNSIVETYLNQDSTLYGYEKFAYDSNDKLTSSAFYSQDSILQQSYKYFYDPNNRLQTIEKYDASNKLIEKITYTRDGNGATTKTKVTDTSGVLLKYSDYAYDYQSYVLKITFYDCVGGTVFRAVHVDFQDERFRIRHNSPPAFLR